MVDMNKSIETMKLIIEKIKEPILAILAALLISCFIISHTRVPTESMLPTIKPGDHLIVNRLPYYYRDPLRGEVIVFEYGKDHLIKRVIGVPGDQIEIKNDEVYVNGQALDESNYISEKMKTYLFTGSDIKFPYIVPEGYYFVMGDNRLNSKDSRVFGPIKREMIIAKAGYRIFPIQSIGTIQ